MKSHWLDLKLLVVCILFLTFLSIGTSQAHAQFRTDFSSCYTYDPIGNNIGQTTINLAGGKTVSIMNSSPGSILQAFTFKASLTQNLYNNCSLNIYGSSVWPMRVKLDFTTPQGGLLSFPNSSAWPVQGTSFWDYGAYSYIASATIPPALDTLPNFNAHSNYLTKVTYNGLKDLSVPIPNEDAIIDSISQTGKINLHASDYYQTNTPPNPGAPAFANVSAPATNCVKLSGNGPIKVVFMRDISYISNLGKPLSAGYFLIEVDTVIKNGFNSIYPFNDSVYNTRFSYYVDLKRYNIPRPGIFFEHDPLQYIQSSCSVSDKDKQVVLYTDTTFGLGGYTLPLGKVVFINSAVGINKLAHTVIHELAHAIGALNDEYVLSSTGVNQSMLSDNRTTCALAPQSSYKGPDNNIYGSTSARGCLYMKTTEFNNSANYYRPSVNSIMNLIHLEEEVLDSRFNVIGCGYLIAGISGETTTKENAQKYWPKCLDAARLGKVIKDGIPPISPVPSVNSVRTTPKTSLNSSSSFFAKLFDSVKFSLLAQVGGANNISLRAGDTITVSGSGFTATDNSAQLVNTTDSTKTYDIDSISSADTVTMSFDVPTTTPPGAYYLKVGAFNSPWTSTVATISVATCTSAACSSSTDLPPGTVIPPVIIPPVTTPPPTITLTATPASITSGQSSTLTWSSTAADINYTYASQFGSLGSGNGQFNSPNGIDIDASGNIYVVDFGNNRVQKFNSAGVYQSQFGSLVQVNPLGIAIDASRNNIYVSDHKNHHIQKYNTLGNFLSFFGFSGSSNGELIFPTDIAIDASGNIYVVDFGNNRVQKFNSLGTYQSKFGGFGSGNGQFSSPNGIAIDVSGNIYVSDLGNDRIQKFNSSGVYQSQFGSLGSGNGQFNNPTGITIDASGNIYVVDLGNNRIQKFNSSGIYQSQFGSLGSGNGQFNNPNRIALDTLGNIYVSDTGNNRIQKFSISNPVAASCTASGAWTGTKTTSGTLVVTPTVTSTYSLTCTGAGGASLPVSALVTVTASTPTIPKVTVLPWSGPSTVVAGQPLTYTLNWNGGPMDKSWSTFEHFVKDDNSYTFGDGFYPSPATNSQNWTGNIQTTHTFTVPVNTPPGTYKVMVGLYSGSTRASTLVSGSGVTSDVQNRFQVGTVKVISAIVSPPVVVTPTTYTLNVAKSGTGIGTVSGGTINCGSTCSTIVNTGTSVILTATPTTGSTFTGWSGACTGIGICTVTATGIATATFNVNDTVPAVTVLPWSGSWAPGSVPSTVVGQPLTYTLNWNGGPMDKSWSTFEHFVKDDNSYTFGDGFYPSPATNSQNWTGNIQTTHTFTVPVNTPPGTYKVMVGLYSGSTRASTLVSGSGVTADTQNRFQVGTVTVTAAPVSFLHELVASVLDAISELLNK